MARASPCSSRERKRSGKRVRTLFEKRVLTPFRLPEILGVLGSGVLIAGALSALTGCFATAVTRLPVALS